MKKKSTLLRERIENEKGLWNPCCYDCLSARIFDAAGADVIAISGYGISQSLLGLPDMGFISLPELTMVTRNVVNVIDTPVLADADTGFGNALNVIRTTRELIRAGAAAMLIEDQLAPKRCGHVAGKQVVPMEEAVGKYRAAADVRKELDPDFVLVARTDARARRVVDWKTQSHVPMPISRWAPMWPLSRASLPRKSWPMWWTR